MTVRVLLVLPCNRCVRLGDYSLCPNWRVVLGSVGDLVRSGLVDLAAIDSCKPGIVPWGMERELRWCDLHPGSELYYKREPWRLGLLREAVLRDLRELLLLYSHIVYYVNVKAYREALDHARKTLGQDKIISAGPPHTSPLSYRSTANRTRLREILLKLAGSRLKPGGQLSY